MDNMDKKETRFTNKKKIFIGVGAIILIALVVVLAIFMNGHSSTSASKAADTATYETVQVKEVTICQTLTAAGKVTGGKEETIELPKKKFKAAAVVKDEEVKSGEPMIYYTDGSHTDAPYDAVVSDVEAPANGEKAGDGYYVKLRSTSELYMRITVPEDKVNDIPKNSPAVVVVNAMPQNEFYGEITGKKDVSNELIGGNSSNDDSDTTDDDEDDDDGLTEEEIDAGADDDSYSDDAGEELGDSSESEGDSSSGNIAYYTVTIKFANNGKVRPGMSANCVITISERDHLLSVPVEAIHFDKKNRAYVKLVDGDEVKNQVVTIGESDAINVEIVEGLSKGDKVQVVSYTQEEAK